MKKKTLGMCFNYCYKRDKSAFICETIYLTVLGLAFKNCMKGPNQLKSPYLDNHLEGDLGVKRHCIFSEISKPNRKVTLKQGTNSCLKLYQSLRLW